MQNTLHRQTSARVLDVRGRLSVKTAVLSPFSRRDFMKEVGTGRDTNISEIMKAIYGLDYYAIVSGNQFVGVGFFDTTTSPATCIDVQNLQLNMADAAGTTALATAAVAAINTYATSQGYSLSDGIWPVFNSTDAVVRAFSTPARAVNTAYQPSVTRDTMVNASVSITATISLTTGQTGVVSLQYADNNTFTTNLVTVQSFSNGNTGSLTIGLNLSQIATAALTGIVPAGKYYRLLTTNTTGTPTYGTPVVQEVLL